MYKVAIVPRDSEDIFSSITVSLLPWIIRQNRISLICILFLIVFILSVVRSQKQSEHANLFAKSSPSETKTFFAIWGYMGF